MCDFVLFTTFYCIEIYFRLNETQHDRFVERKLQLLDAKRSTKPIN